MRTLTRLGSLPVTLAVITAITALYFTLVAFGNLTDFNTNQQFVHHVLAMDSTFNDPDVMWRRVTNTLLADIGYLGVILWEVLVAGVLITALVHWVRSVFDTAHLETARRLSTLGWTMAIALFAGGFITVGGEWFQMWQSDTWNGLQPALQNFLIAAVGLILAHLPQAPPVTAGGTAKASGEDVTPVGQTSEVTDFVSRFVTEPDVLAAHRRITGTLQDMVAAIPRDRLDDPTPCGDWTVRRLVSHLADTNEEYGTLAATGNMPDETPGYDDPVAAFPVEVAKAREAFSRPGYLTTVAPTPIGPQPGKVVVQHVINEMAAHGWDLARALGVSTDLESDIAARSLASWRAFFAGTPRSAMGGNFGKEKSAGPEATEADRLAAYLGREV